MKVAFAAGGTGGHLYPALVTAEEMQRRNPSFHGFFLVSRRGVERRILESSGFPFYELPVSSFGNDLSLRAVSSLVSMLDAWRKSVALLREEKARVLVGFGAYVSVPAVLAASALGMKIVIHEQNAVMGRANRWLTRFADRVAVGLPQLGERNGVARDYVLTGIPLRQALSSGMGKEESLDCLGLSRGVFTLLIMGGSQGAHALNQVAAEAAGLLAREGGFQIVHLSGSRDYETVLSAYARAGVRAAVFPFLAEMEWAYAVADLAECRCGAMTLAELAQAGLPSLLVPYPGSVGGHQEANGVVLARTGAALLMRESDLTPGGFAEAVISLRKDAGMRSRMSESARRLATPRASEKLADLIEDAVRDPTDATRAVTA